MMGKIYSMGDIVLFRNIKLIDNDGKYKLDTRIKGHPFIILNDIDDFGQTALCLKCSSSKRGKRRNSHIKVDNIKIRDMKQKSTYIEIKNIYEITIDKIVLPSGQVSTKLLDKLKEKVKDKLIDITHNNH